MFRECMTSYTDKGPLICIDALKKLCNHPNLVYNKAQHEPVTGDESEVTAFVSHRSVPEIFKVFQLVSPNSDPFPTIEDDENHTGDKIQLYRAS